MNILITGGLGYVGGRLACFLKDKEPSVNIYLTTRGERRKLPSWVSGFTVLPMNLLDQDSIAAAFKHGPINAIIHLAGLNKSESARNPEFALEVNAKGTYRLLRQATANGVRTFIYFSTFHVYGDVGARLITELTPTRPIDPYAITHRAAEDFVNYFRHDHKVKTLILRLSNAYGYPAESGCNCWSLAFNELCRQAVTTGKIVLRSSGTQYRNFISLGDVGRAVRHLLYLEYGRCEDGLYNLGGRRTMSLDEVAQTIARIYKRKYGATVGVVKEDLERGLANDITTAKRFTYSIAKIKRSGFWLEEDMPEEIERTLSRCEEFRE